MLDKIKSLRERRNALIAKSRALIETAEKADRNLNAEERAEDDKMSKDIDALSERIAALERQCEREDESKDDEEREEEDCEREEEVDEEEREDDEESDEEEGERSLKKYKGVKRHLIKLPDGRWAKLVRPGDNRRSGKNGVGGGEKRKLERRAHESELEYRNRVRRSTPEYTEACRAYLMGGLSALTGKHMRAIQADSDLLGGYLVMPQEFMGQLIKFVDNAVVIRQLATKYTVATAQSLGAPSLDTDVADFDWTAELATGNEDSSLAFGKRELHPHPLAKRVKVSNKLLRSASISGTFSADGSVGGGPEALVRNRLGYKVGVTQETAFMTGHGAQRPLGLFTASTRGISTGRDVTTGSTTGFTADQLWTAKYTLKPQYWATAKWLFHRDALRRIRQLKDGIGQYVWASGLNGTPDTLCDVPVIASEYAPNTFTTGQYVGLLFDPSFYWIVDAETLQIQALKELYAEANQMGYIARLDVDGMPVLEEAFVRLITD